MKKITDHPLNRDKTSEWNTLFEDQNLWNTIEKDARRTKSNLEISNQVIYFIYLIYYFNFNFKILI